MAYSTDFYRLTFGGGVYNNQDIWSCGINFASTVEGEGSWNEDAAQEAVEGDITDALVAWIQGQAGISSHAELQWVKLAPIGTDGKYRYDAVINDLVDPVHGQVTDPIAPQLTTVVSLTTERSRGRAHIGRIYPPLSGVVSSNGRLSTATQQNMANSAVGLIDALNAAMEDLFAGAVRAYVMSNIGTGTRHVITGVRVGDVVDTQRSRRNAFVETYFDQELAS